MEAKNFDRFKQTIEREFMGHAAVTKNQYTKWFAQGDVPLNHLRDFTVQFSVFSNQFLLAALNRVINADTLEASREAKEILMNELGVIYNKQASGAGLQASGSGLQALGAGPRASGFGLQASGFGLQTSASAPQASGAEAEISGVSRTSTIDREGDPTLVSTEGTVDGGKFRFQAAHFEWLLRFGEPLGLTFDDMGKRRHGTPATLYFCDELFRLYGSEDYNAAMGASFAVENWAAAGFWKELIAGLEQIKARNLPDLPLAFFTWHDRIEDQHKEHTWDELRACYDSAKFLEAPFIRAGVAMLDGVKVFWDGLNELRGHPRVRVA